MLFWGSVSHWTWTHHLAGLAVLWVPGICLSLPDPCPLLGLKMQGLYAWTLHGSWRSELRTHWLTWQESYPLSNVPSCSEKFWKSPITLIKIHFLKLLKKRNVSQKWSNNGDRNIFLNCEIFWRCIKIWRVMYRKAKHLYLGTHIWNLGLIALKGYTFLSVLVIVYSWDEPKVMWHLAKLQCDQLIPVGTRLHAFKSRHH